MNEPWTADLRWVDFSPSLPTTLTGCTASTCVFYRYLRINAKLMAVQAEFACTGTSTTFLVPLPVPCDSNSQTIALCGTVVSGYTGGGVMYFPLIASGDASNMRVASTVSPFTGLHGDAFTTSGTIVSINSLVSI